MQLARDAPAFAFLDPILRLDEAPQLGMRLGQRVARFREFGHAAHDQDDRRVARILDQRSGRLDETHRAVCAQNLHLHQRRDRRTGAKCRDGRPGLLDRVGVDQLQRRSAQQGARVGTEQALRGLVDEADAVAAADEHRVGQHPQQPSHAGFAVAQRILGLVPFGDVAQDHRVLPPAAGDQVGDRRVDRKLRAVGAHGHHVTLATHVARRAGGLPEGLHVGSVRGAMARRDELPERCAHQLADAAAEDRGGCRIGLDDGLGLVGDEDRDGGGLEDAAQHLLAVGQCRLGPPAYRGVAHRDEQCAPAAVVDRRAADLQFDRAAVEFHEHLRAAGRRVAFLDRHVHPLQRRPAQVRRDEVDAVPSDQVVGRIPAEQGDAGRVDEQNLAVEVNAQSVREPVHQRAVAGLAFAARPLAGGMRVEHVVELLCDRGDLGGAGHGRACGGVAGRHPPRGAGETRDRSSDGRAQAPGQHKRQQQHAGADAGGPAPRGTEVREHLGLGQAGGDPPAGARHGAEREHPGHAVAPGRREQPFAPVLRRVGLTGLGARTDEGRRIGGMQQHGVPPVQHRHHRAGRCRREQLLVEGQQIDRQCQHPDDGAGRAADRLRQHRDPAARQWLDRGVAGMEGAAAHGFLEPRRPL